MHAHYSAALVGLAGAESRYEAAPSVSIIELSWWFNGLLGKRYTVYSCSDDSFTFFSELIDTGMHPFWCNNTQGSSHCVPAV